MTDAHATETDAIDIRTARKKRPTLPEVVRGHAAAHPGRTALIFRDHGRVPSGSEQPVTYAELDERAASLATELAERTSAGARAGILCPQGLDYAVAFLGCLYAGVIAVPLHAPGEARRAGRLEAVLADAAPEVVLTTGSHRAEVEELSGAAAVVCVERVRAGTGRPPWDAPEPGRIAYLQYTSGSTSAPAGAVITHGALAASLAQIASVSAHPHSGTVAGWLPLFHDMGLVTQLAFPLWQRLTSVFATPLAFVQRPARWLRMLTEHRAAFSAVPGFALEMCLTLDRDSAWDLSGLRILACGSEPVRSGTVGRFVDRFAAHGLDPAALLPAYGLAEATVLVSMGPRGKPPSIRTFDAAALALGRVVPAADESAGTRTLVGCGAPVQQRLQITDPGTGCPCPPDRVGEIQVSGPNLATGYWRRPERSAEVFGHGRVRTGDLGFLHEGQVYVLGRTKDVIIIDGANHHAADLEDTARHAAGGTVPNGIAAFGVDDGERENLVIVIEAGGRRTHPGSPSDPTARVRGLVAERHGVRVHDVVLTRRGGIPKTSSGKQQRAACRAAYLAGDLPPARGA